VIDDNVKKMIEWLNSNQGLEYFVEEIPTRAQVRMVAKDDAGNEFHGSVFNSTEVLKEDLARRVYVVFWLQARAQAAETEEGLGSDYQAAFHRHAMEFIKREFGWEAGK
jgi:hypothetical protein